ncbi:hypothetical protein [Caballeronia zhejiangensis]|uniref:hypothetical protein n=1 Tax=Caballeronia zhejiangensis TaxID=871203 RepID=UPI001FD43A65|nr:hypothetical protein [Caballeronia zhejiangensis]
MRWGDMVPDANDALAFDTWLATVVRQLRSISHQRAKNLGGDKLRIFDALPLGIGLF